MSISEQKSALRKELLENRIGISTDVWKEKSDKVIVNLKSLSEYNNAECIHCYVSMDERREVHTHEFIQNALADGKRVIIPVTQFETNTLLHSEIKSLEELELNKWGVLEPKKSKETDLIPDLILVPLLAADKNFNRLGYGKGFYDRFLNEADAVKAGLLFEDFIIDEVPVENFDEKLDILISEENIFRRNNSSEQP